MSKQALVFASCSLGILFLAGFSEFESSGFGQSSLAPETVPEAKDEEATRCLESTCRNVPIRESLSAIHLGAKYIRGIVGGFEQGAGIAGGVRVTSADAIPAMSCVPRR